MPSRHRQLKVNVDKLRNIYRICVTYPLQKEDDNPEYFESYVDQFTVLKKPSVNSNRHFHFYINISRIYC